MSLLQNDDPPNALEMSLDDYIKESGIYVSPMLHQRRIEDNNYDSLIKGRRIRDLLNNFDEDEDDDDDISMLDNDSGSIEVCSVNNVSIDKNMNFSDLLNNSRANEPRVRRGQQWRLSNGNIRSSTSSPVLSNDSELDPYALNQTPTTYNRVKKNILNKNRLNFSYYYRNKNNANGRNRIQRPKINLNQRLKMNGKLGLRSMDTIVSVPSSGNKNNLIVSRPKKGFLASCDSSMNLLEGTDNSKVLTNVLQPNAVIKAEIMPLIASQLLESFRVLTESSQPPKYDMKTQKEIHAVQNKDLFYSCPRGEVVSCDGKGLPNCTIRPQSSGVTLNNRFA